MSQESRCPHCGGNECQRQWIVVCDGCGAEAPDNGVPPGWVVLKVGFIELANRSYREPIMHACSAACVERAVMKAGAYP